MVGGGTRSGGVTMMLRGSSKSASRMGWDGCVAPTLKYGECGGKAHKWEWLHRLDMHLLA